MPLVGRCSAAGVAAASQAARSWFDLGDFATHRTAFVGSKLDQVCARSLLRPDMPVSTAPAVGLDRFDGLGVPVDAAFEALMQHRSCEHAVDAVDNVEAAVFALSKANSSP